MNTTRSRLVAGLLISLVVGFLHSSPATAAQPAGTFEVTGYLSASGVEVRFYKSTDGADDGPFELAATTTVDSSSHYGAFLTPGTYKATFNEVENGSVASRARQSDVWTDYNGKKVFVVKSKAVSLESRQLAYKGGEIFGSLDRTCKDSQQAGRILAFAADDPDPAHADVTPIRFRDGSDDLDYTAHAFGGPTKFKIELAGHDPLWIGGESFETATATTIAPDDRVRVDVRAVRGFSDGQPGRIRSLLRDWQEPVNGLTVRFYRSESDRPEGPWTLVKQQKTPSASGLEPGMFDADLPTGLYRLTANEFPDGSAPSRAHSSTTFTYPYRTHAGSNFDLGDTICVDGSTDDLGWFSVGVTGGTISGTAKDKRGKPVPKVTVAVYTDDTTGAASEEIRSTTTRDDGTYIVQGISGAAKLKFTPIRGYEDPRGVELYATSWSGDVAAVGQATTVTADEGETAELDATLADAPITIAKKPSIRTAPRVGRNLRTNPGVASLDLIRPPQAKTTVSYQWLRYTGSKSVSIKGATKLAYSPTAADLGHTLALRATYTAPKSFPGVAPATTESNRSSIVRTAASVKATAKRSGSKKFKVSATVGLQGFTRPSGTAYVQWVALKPKGDYLYATGKVFTKKVRYVRGKLRYTVKTSKKGYWAYQVTVDETKTVIGAYDDGYLKVK